MLFGLLHRCFECFKAIVAANQVRQLIGSRDLLIFTSDFKRFSCSVVLLLWFALACSGLLWLAQVQGLDTSKLYISHIQVNAAPTLRRRTYRAHGRIGPYMSNPCHIQLILTLRREQVKKGETTQVAEIKPKKRLENGATASA